MSCRAVNITVPNVNFFVQLCEQSANTETVSLIVNFASKI